MNKEPIKNRIVEEDRYRIMLDICCTAKVFVENFSDYIHDVYGIVPWSDFDALETAVNKLKNHE